MGNLFDLSGRVAAIFGAAGGIGRAASAILGEQGARLLLADRAAPEDLADDLRRQGMAARAVAADVRSRKDVEAAVGEEERIDILVYLSAISPWDDDWRGAEWDAVFDDVIAVNLHGAVHAARAVMPGMAARRWGRIVLVGSLAGKNGGLIAGGHYAASKGGLHTLVKWLAQRGGPDNVIVNGIAPASTITPMMEGRPVDTARIPLRRMSEPREIAGPIAFLSSEAASYVCGTVLDVNGGVFMG